jgi:hypothetical protein
MHGAMLKIGFLIGVFLKCSYKAILMVSQLDGFTTESICR